MPAAASTNPVSTIGRRPRPPALARSDAAPAQGTRSRSDVVDGHDGADGRAMVAERVAHERRDEGAEQRTGDAGEESAQADEQ